VSFLGEAMYVVGGIVTSIVSLVKENPGLVIIVLFLFAFFWGGSNLHPDHGSHDYVEGGYVDGKLIGYCRKCGHRSDEPYGCCHKFKDGKCIYCGEEK